jgi:putative DNA primase/helicase
MADINLGEFLEREVYPRLSADQVYGDAAHNWQKGPEKWRGDCFWHKSKSKTALNVTVPTLTWFCPGCGFGGGPVQYLHRRKGGKGSPRGADFIAIVRELAELAGVPFPERNLSAQEQEELRRRDARRAVLTAVAHHCEEVLWSNEGAAAREYLVGRGFTPEDMRNLQLGLYLSSGDVRRFLVGNEHSLDDAKAAGVLWPDLEGYILFPWFDDAGQILTLYGKWHDGKPPEGTPKTIALPNPKGKDKRDWEKTKRSPMYLDRAVRAGHKNVVLVEGVSDAALLQVRGDSRVIACVGSRLSREQVQTLARRQVQAVTIVLDPDEAGDGGTRSCIESLDEAGITPFVAPKLPDGMDPDDFVIAHGVGAWRAHVDQAEHGYRHVARSILESARRAS